MSKQILTFDMLEPERDFIVIGKNRYFLRDESELSLTEIAKIRRGGKMLQEKGISVDSSEEDMVQVEALVNQILGMLVLDLPAEVRDKLTILQKAKIVKAFTDAAASRRAMAAAEEDKAPPTTGDSSPDSDISTAAPSASG